MTSKFFIKVPSHLDIVVMTKKSFYPVYSEKLQKEMTAFSKVRDVMLSHFVTGLLSVNISRMQQFKEKCEADLFEAGISTDILNYVQMDVEDDVQGYEYIFSMTPNVIFPELSKILEINTLESSLKKGLACADNLAVQVELLKKQLVELKKEGAPQNILDLWLQKIKDIRANKDFLRHETILINLFNDVDLAYLNHCGAGVYDAKNYA